MLGERARFVETALEQPRDRQEGVIQASLGVDVERKLERRRRFLEVTGDEMNHRRLTMRERRKRIQRDRFADQVDRLLRVSQYPGEPGRGAERVGVAGRELERALERCVGG